jgi:heme exporter protein C
MLQYNWHKLISPPTFFSLSKKLLPWLQGSALLLLGLGLVSALYLAPPDYQQGEAYRIMYIHVPAAFFSMSLYALLAVCSLVYLVWHIKLSFLVARAAAEIGAMLTVLALVTGSLWGKPMWGAFWVWDARLTSELILLFLYVGFLSLYRALSANKTAAKACSILALVGAVDLPIIHYSVYWWNTLHQGATVSQWQSGTIAFSMLVPLFIMLAGFMAYIGVCVLLRVQAMLLVQERQQQWIKGREQGAC